jgi:sarcosine oxidase
MGPAAGGRVLKTKTCLYTLTPDRDFVVDRLPELPNAWLCLGSAHAYKFGSLLGRILAEFALDGTSPFEPDLTAFGLDRPSLTDPDGGTMFVR